MTRWIQAFVPLLLTPLVWWWLDATGNDKAPVFIIPWLAFAVSFAIVFLLLARAVKRTWLLVPAALVASIPGAIGLTALAISMLKANAGY